MSARKVRMKMGQLRKLFTEGELARMINEDDSASHETGVSGDSLDSQVDRYLTQYEGEAKKSGDDVGAPSVDQMESIDWRDLVKGRILTEAGQDDDAAAGDDVADELPDAGAPTDGEPEKLGIDKIDVAAYANSVVRLIENYDSMLEVRSTLQRRARSFLEKVYDDEVLQAFESTMRDDHGMEAGVDAGSTDSDKYPAPAADRASGSAAPGPGGAGGAPV